MQGPFFYEAFIQLGYSSADINKLFVLGLLSSLTFGSCAGYIADKFSSVVFVLVYSITSCLSCLTIHSKFTWIHIAGRILGGLSTSLLHSVFDSWLCEERNLRGCNKSQLVESFTRRSFINSLMAILSGIAAQATYQLLPLVELDQYWLMWGFTTPFDIASISLTLSGLVVLLVFPVSRRAREPRAEGEISLGKATYIFKDRTLLLVCLTESLFESSVYIFVFSWARALREAVSTTDAIEYGLIFTSFMAANMIGSSSAGTLNARQPFLTAIFVACVSHIGVTMSTESAPAMYICFLGFEACVGGFYPSMASFKARQVPPEMRVFAYNLFRVPMNTIVSIALMSNMSVVNSYFLTSILLSVSALTGAILTYQTREAIPD